MAVSLAVTLGLPRLLEAGSDEVTAGPGTSTTTTEAPTEVEAPAGGPAPSSPAAPAAPAASGEPDPEEPGSSVTPTTTRRATPQPTRSGPTVTAPPTTAPPATVPSGPPWRANPISIFPPGTIVAGQSAEFGVTVRGHGNVYQVAFGDGSSTGSASTFGCDDYSAPSAHRHTFETPGRYTLIVRINGSGSCSTLARDFRTTTKSLTFDVVAA